MTGTNTTLEDWNRLPQDAAMHAILPMNGARAWAIGMVNARSFNTPDECFHAADQVWSQLSDADRQTALDSHPRLGESHARAATPASLAHSAGEQQGITSDASAQSALAVANREYEAKFHRTFILCATGKSPADVLAAIAQRMGNTPEQEFAIACEQQRQITQLRLHKWLGVS